MMPPERWTGRLRNFLAAVIGTIALLCILVAALVVAAIIRAVRWMESREADGCLLGVMMILLAITLLALLVAVVLASPARAEWVPNTSTAYEQCLLDHAKDGYVSTDNGRSALNLMYLCNVQRQGWLPTVGREATGGWTARSCPACARC